MIALGIIGDGHHAQALRAHGAPLGEIRLVDPPGRDWRDIATDTALAAVLVDLPDAAGLAAIGAALGAGKTVISAPCPARSSAELAGLHAAAKSGGGILLPGGELTHGEAARRGLAVVAGAEFGALTSLYIAIRQPRGRGDVLDDLAPEAIGFITAASADDCPAVRVNAGGLFGGGRDSAVILLRSAGNVVVTVELAKCLPASLPAPGLGEIEIEAIGTNQAIRITPLDSAVRVHRDDGIGMRPWLDAAVLAMLGEVAAPPDGGLERAARNAGLFSAIRAAA